MLFSQLDEAPRPPRRVVVTGMGIVSSIGEDCAQVQASLHAARSGITTDPDHVTYKFRSQVSGRPGVNWEEVLDRRTRRFMTAATGWNYIAMEEAIAAAGLERDEISNPRTGMIVGSGGPSTRILADVIDTARARGARRVTPLAVPKTMSSSNSAVLATLFAIKGVNYTISSACATSAHCIGNGAQLIEAGLQDMMIVGGGEAVDWPTSIMFDAMGALSSAHNDDPTRASRAYDAKRDGFVIAGGAGVLILEALDHARARGAKIYGELCGYGANSDGAGDMVAPSGEGAERCMRSALAGIGESVGYINTHGTSTPIGDEEEIEAITKIFGDEVPLLSSTKSLTGHSLGATGVNEAIYTLLMINAGFLCESAHIETLDPVFANVPILQERADKVDVQIAMSNSFGFGGTNACLVFRHPEAI